VTANKKQKLLSINNQLVVMAKQQQAAV